MARVYVVAIGDTIAAAIEAAAKRTLRELRGRKKRNQGRSFNMRRLSERCRKSFRGASKPISSGHPLGLMRRQAELFDPAANRWR